MGDRDHSTDSFERDLALVNRALEGDGASRAELGLRLEAMHHLVRIEMLRRTHRVQPNEVDDLAQETLVRVWERLPRYRGHSDVEGWARGHVRMIVRAFLRTRLIARWRRVELSREAAQTLMVPEVAPNPSAVALERALERGLRSLSKLEREAVILRAVEGHDYRSLSRLLGCSERAARGRYERGLLQLRRALGVDSKAD